MNLHERVWWWAHDMAKASIHNTGATCSHRLHRNGRKTRRTSTRLVLKWPSQLTFFVTINSNRGMTRWRSKYWETVLIKSYSAILTLPNNPQWWILNSGHLCFVSKPEMQPSNHHFCFFSFFKENILWIKRMDFSCGCKCVTNCIRFTWCAYLHIYLYMHKKKIHLFIWFALSSA